MSSSPSRQLWNTILSPPGDQSGLKSQGPLVNGCSFEPSAFIAQICSVPVRFDQNAICCPSGDQEGAALAVVPPSLDVNGCWLVPSQSITQISGQNASSQTGARWNAIFVSTGLHAGSSSRVVPDVRK